MVASALNANVSRQIAGQGNRGILISCPLRLYQRPCRLVKRIPPRAGGRFSTGDVLI
jgi:hypothetical protein